MLKSLHIENIAVIEKTDIDLSAGFNTLTGETGAGKSIVIDSINAVLGERTSKDLIRNGCDKASVSALFCNLSDVSINALKENGYDVDEDGNLLIIRTLSLNGNGSVKINGAPATASVLKIIGKYLVNIHGQHDNQSLLNPDLHFTYIDKLAENDKLLSEYYEEFRQLNSIRKELNSVETDEEEKQRRKSLLEFQIEELRNADIKIGESDELRAQLKIADNYNKMMSALSNAHAYLSGSDDSDGASSLINNAKVEVSSLDIRELDSTVQTLDEALFALEEVSVNIRRFTDNSSLKELDSEKLGQRLDLLRRLMLKYGNSEEAMLVSLQKYEEELKNIELSDERAKHLEEELDKSTERLIELGDKLTQSRLAAAKKFSKAVTDVLLYLNMPDVEFSVKREKGRYTKFGCDVIEFMIKTNAGETEKPLHKIASGGELSRTMLAIKSVLAEKDDVDTLIFDEIDSGISGRAADKVGVQLKRVSDSRQVICVTHLAQIAAFGDSHLLIEKTVNNGRTYTDVSLLSGDRRIEEIARIMSGTDMTDNLYNSAKELLDRSSIYENL
ncbi:MAG: DNA repair protein RecN [Clostridia bacterium]|nr:DNA repair protein RecN [Clostridia bacterium]